MRPMASGLLGHTDVTAELCWRNALRQYPECRNEDRAAFDSRRPAAESQSKRALNLDLYKQNI